MKQNISYDNMIKKGFTTFFKDWKLFVTVALLMTIPIILLNFMQESVAWRIILLVTIVIVSLIAFMIYTLAVPLFLKGKRDLEKGAWHHIEKSFLPLLTTYILITLIMLLTIIIVLVPISLIYWLFILIAASSTVMHITFAIIAIVASVVASIIVGTYMFFAPFIVVLEKKKCIYAVKESYKRVKKKFKATLGAFIIIKLIAIALSIIPVIALAPFYIINNLNLSIIIEQLALVAQYIFIIPATLMGIIYFLYEGYKVKKKPVKKVASKKKKK